MSGAATQLLAAASGVALVGGIARSRRDRTVGRLPAPISGGAFDVAPPAASGSGHAARGSRRARRRRSAAVDAEIPQLLDLLAAGSSAGLSAPLALRRAADGLTGPLADEVRAAVRAVDLGARWKDELERLAQRLDLPDLRRTVAALTRTETLGSSLAEATARLADEVRRARRSATAERARTAPVKMLFPLVFLVLPAFLLLTVVPVLLTTVRSIG